MITIYIIYTLYDDNREENKMSDDVMYTHVRGMQYYMVRWYHRYTCVNVEYVSHIMYCVPTNVYNNPVIPRTRSTDKFSLVYIILYRHNNICNIGRLYKKKYKSRKGFCSQDNAKKNPNSSKGLVQKKLTNVRTETEYKTGMWYLNILVKYRLNLFL